jgi:hypothetical protein
MDSETNATTDETTAAAGETTATASETTASSGPMPIAHWATKLGHWPPQVERAHSVRRPTRPNKKAWIARAVCVRLGLTIDAEVDEQTYCDTAAKVAAEQAR